MTNRERLITTLSGKIPDCVPVMPDMSNMMPAKRTGLPFWDIYLYKKIPAWRAYIDNAKYYDIDILLDGYYHIRCPELDPIDTELKTAIVFQDESKIITQNYKKVNGKYFWNEYFNVFPVDNPPMWGIVPREMKMDSIPTNFKDVEGVEEGPEGAELLSILKKEIGDSGLVGVFVGSSNQIGNEKGIYRYYDDPDFFYKKRDKMLDYVEKKYKWLMSLKDKPDFIACGGSGTLIWQTFDMFLELGYPVVKKVTDMAARDGVFTHVHSCGPEAKLVEYLSQNTSLTVIDPLEIPPMGDCILKELKRKFGDKIVLKGNLHTTGVMLMGSVEEVKEAAKRAIDDAAEGGRFILSSGDQCGRDTPPENIFAMVEVARTYGKY
jgi:uroporphyrinogen decarboxylase